MKRRTFCSLPLAAAHRGRRDQHSLLAGGDVAVMDDESGIQINVSAERRHAIDTIVKLVL